MTAVSHEGHAAGTRFEVTPLTDAQAIRPVIEHDRVYAAYAIAQLDPLLFEANEWWLSRGPAGRDALLVHSASGLGAALFALGDPEALDAAISLHPGPRFTFGSLRLEHRAMAEKHFVLSRPQLMTRMSVNAATFKPVTGSVVRLGPADVADVNKIYSIEGGPTAYRPGHLEDGVYYGLYVGGRLISIAGTHVVSRAERIAVVGNVFTHPSHRGKGYATVTTSAVTEELLRDCDPVVLTVESKNASALAIYMKLGYQAVCSLRLGALVRRGIASWRGRDVHKEVVVR
jgi:RimJ/RimL family protein N-acetyltransferase